MEDRMALLCAAGSVALVTIAAFVATKRRREPVQHNAKPYQLCSLLLFWASQIPLADILAQAGPQMPHAYPQVPRCALHAVILLIWAGALVQYLGEKRLFSVAIHLGGLLFFVIYFVLIGGVQFRLTREVQWSMVYGCYVGTLLSIPTLIGAEVASGLRKRWKAFRSGDTGRKPR